MAQRIDKDSLKLDQPRRTPGHPTKSHVVKTKIDGKEKILRFGEQGAKTAGKPKAGESQAMKDKRASFKSRHAKNIAKGKSSPAYWADKVKWAEGGEVKGMAVGGGWGAMAEANKAAASNEREKQARAEAAASMRSAGVTGIGGGTRPADREGPLTARTMASDLGNMVELDRTVYDDDDDDRSLPVTNVSFNNATFAPSNDISDEMRRYLSSPPGAYPEPMGPVSPPSVIKTTLLNDNVAPLSQVSQVSQPSQPRGFLGTLMDIPGAIGRDLKMGYQAGLFRSRDTQRENLMEAGYTPAEINDYFARTDATLARNAAEAAMRGNRDDAGMQAPSNYADLARAFAQEYNVVGRNRTQLMPLLETFLRSRGILDPSTYSENIFNTLSIPMQEGGSVDLERLLERYGPRGADARRERPIEQDGMVYDEWARGFITPEQRLSQLREFQREMPRDYEDYLAAGFRQPELTAANITRPLPSYRARNYMTPEQAAEIGFGTLEAYEPTLREKHTYALEEGLQKLGASRSLARDLAEGALGNPESTSDLGIGLADFTPMSLIYGGQEGARTFERGINAGDPLTAGLGAAEVGLSALEAFPLTAAGGRALKRALPTAEDALNRMLDSYDPNVLGSNLGNIGGGRGRRPPPLISPEERTVISGIGKRADQSAIRDQISAQKMSYPADQGWAQDAMSVAKITPKDGKFKVAYKEVPYNFEKPPENMSPDEWQRTMVGRQVDEIRKLAQRAKDGDPAAMDIIRQANWYRSMRSALRNEFGGMGDVFADVLGATSAQTGVEMNWRNAVEIMRRYSRGEYDDEIRMYQEMLDSGDVNPTRLQQMHKDPDNPFRLITNAAGALFNTNSPAATKALFDMFRVADGAPKTPNFTGNLIGYTNAATVDVWDARHLRRLAGLPRLPPPVEKGVTGEHLKGSTLEEPKIGGEFGFGQRVKRDAARIINDEGILREVAPDLEDMNPDDLQAVAWFLEKELWTKNGWTNKAGEGGSFEYEASLAGAASPENVTALRRELNQRFKPPAPRKTETEEQYAERVAAAKSVFDARQIEAMNELDAMKAPLARYVLGISVERPGMRPSNLRQAEVAERLGEPAKVDPSVVMYQINNTYGRFMKADERSFNAEFVTRKGFDPSAVTRRMVEIAKESNQDSAFISRVLPQRTENSRPGVEIYFRKRQGPDFARKLSDKLSDYGVDGFTYVTDNRVMDRPRAQAGASEEAVAGINGLRFQYIPEFDMGRDAWAAMSPAERAAKIDEIEDVFNVIINDIEASEPGISGANLMHYETNLFERGDYDGLLAETARKAD